MSDNNITFRHENFVLIKQNLKKKMNEFYENQVGSNRNVWTKKLEQVVNDYLNKC